MTDLGAAHVAVVKTESWGFSVNGLTFIFYFQLDFYKNRSVIKIEVYDGNHWLTYPELRHAYETGNPTAIGATLRMTFQLLLAHGMDKVAIQRFLERKQVFVNGTDIPLNELIKLGWKIKDYPIKYGVSGREAKAALLDDARKTVTHLDASNALFDTATVRTNGLAMLGLINLLKSNAIPLRLYVDYSTFGKLAAKGMVEVRSYLDELLADHGSTRCITESPHGKPVDPILLDWANRTDGHAISRDSFDDFDHDFPSVIFSASAGKPRLHKFVCDGETVGVPDFGLSGPIPSAF